MDTTELIRKLEELKQDRIKAVSKKYLIDLEDFKYLEPIDLYNMDDGLIESLDNAIKNIKKL